MDMDTTTTTATTTSVQHVRAADVLVLGVLFNQRQQTNDKDNNDNGNDHNDNNRAQCVLVHAWLTLRHWLTTRGDFPGRTKTLLDGGRT